jgi:Fe-S oxidoreductase
VRGVPRRSRLFGSIRALNRLGAATAPLSNLPARLPLVRRAMAAALGIAPARPLPHYTRDTTTRWFRRRDSRGRGAPLGEVVFLADSFTTFTEPGPAKAGIELLRLAGYDVRLEAGGCCGRAALSKGLVAKATAQAQDLNDRLGGRLVVGCEPSCTGMLLDISMPVQGTRPRVRQLEELLVEAIDAGHLTPAPESAVSGKRIVFHGHCHQKADVGTTASMALLSRIPGAEVVEIDAGCCGMAGSFGFEAEHYELSMTIGEDRLFPAVRAEAGSTVLAATGVSCRQQIAHGTGRRARHPVELLLQAVTGDPAAAAGPVRRRRRRIPAGRRRSPAG